MHSINYTTISLVNHSIFLLVGNVVGKQSSWEYFSFIAAVSDVRRLTGRLKYRYTRALTIDSRQPKPKDQTVSVSPSDDVLELKFSFCMWLDVFACVEEPAIRPWKKSMADVTVDLEKGCWVDKCLGPSSFSPLSYLLTGPLQSFLDSCFISVLWADPMHKCAVDIGHPIIFVTKKSILRLMFINCCISNSCFLQTEGLCSLFSPPCLTWISQRKHLLYLDSCLQHF